jgi:hypothetical protein
MWRACERRAAHVFWSRAANRGQGVSGQSDKCIDCDGTGRYPSGAQCRSCEGTPGRVLKGDGEPVAKPKDGQSVECAKCRGTGVIPGSILAFDRPCDCAKAGQSIKPTWHGKAAARVAPPARIAVGSDLHLLEMALKEREELAEKVRILREAVLYAIKLRRVDGNVRVHLDAALIATGGLVGDST